MESKTEVEDLSTLAADVVSLEGDAVELKDSLAEINAEIARKKEKIRAELGGPVKGVPAGDLTIDWAPPKRSFDTAAFVKAFPPENNQYMYKMVPDPAMIPPAVKQQFMTEGSGEGTVTIK